MASHVETSKVFFLALFTLIVGIAGGIIIGYFVMVDKAETRQHKDLFEMLNRDEWKESDDVKSKILKMVEPGRIRENLREFSKEPHIAGTQRDEDLARYIQNTWLQNGLDSAELVPYTVLLSHPNPQKLNTINIFRNDSDIYLTIVPLEKPLREEEKAAHATQGFHAYSPSGNVTGELVFAMDGSDYDFEMLETLNIDVKGKILLVTERSVDHAIQHGSELGAVGVLSYPDPVFYARSGATEADVYPNTSLLPGSGLITTPILISSGNFGDMLTPGYPATEQAYRSPIENGTFSQIPSQPIGYADAMKLLSLLGGHAMPEQWHINISDLVNFRIGPGFADPGLRDVQLIVNNRMKETKIHNVIGTIKGSVEPDRYILYGNHRDAWSFGAVDPASGTSVMMELSRIFGKLLQEGWRPRRTIIFASWSGEEYGLIGSTEWVEEKLPKLHHRAVMYINTDICAIGEQFYPTASKSLDDAIFEVAKLVPDPKKEYNNVYETMFNQSIYVVNGSRPGDPWIADVHQSGIMSDHIPFFLLANVPYMDVNWRREFSIMESPPYSTYHTGYDTFYYMDKFVDPTYTFHRSCAQLSGLMMHYFADSLIVPYNLTRYVNFVDAINERMKSLKNIGVSVEPLSEATAALKNAVKNWYKRLEDMDMKNPMVVRMLNDQLIQFERSTIFLTSPRQTEATEFYGGRSVFIRSIHGITKIVSMLAVMKDENHQQQLLKAMKLKDNLRAIISDLTIVANQAAQSLQPFHVV